MNNTTVKFIIVIVLILTYSCKLFDSNSKEEKILGCTDPAANNYDPDANEDDGSCNFCLETSSFILITKDGGTTWDKKCFNIPTSTVIDISIVDENNIWVCTSPMIVGQTKAQILHSSNGGYTWTEQYEDTGNNDFFNYIEMFDENTGIAMGDGKDYYPLFLKTTDGGNTWIKTTTSQIGLSGDTWRRLDFIDIDNGYFHGSKPGWNPFIYKTENSGNNWASLFFADSTNVWVLKFYDENLGLMSVKQDEYFRTTDGGNTWERQYIDFGGGWALDIEFHPTNSELVWMGVTSNYLFSSNDGGVSWTREQTNFPEVAKIWDIYAGNNTVWCSGYWKDKELFVNRDIAQHNWEMVQLPLEENDRVDGVIDGVGDNIIVIPGQRISIE